MTRASGIGSWPGKDPALANGTIRNALAEHDLPFLAELPARGPGADLIGRGAALLVDLPVELTPSGWRHADAPGRDAGLAAGFLRSDLDALAEIYDGYDGELKIQAAGPWTLAASIELPRGERSLTDAGAVSDLSASLAEGLRHHVADVRRLVPGAQVIVQIDEPSLPSVLAGRLPTASGYGRVRAVDPQRVETVLRELFSVLTEHHPVLHCCAADVPQPLLRQAGARGIALDVSLLGPNGWESVAAGVEEGMTFFPGVDVDAGSAPAADSLVRAWDRLGLDPAILGGLVVTPPCGLPALSTASATARLRTLTEVARRLDDIATG